MLCLILCAFCSFFEECFCTCVFFFNDTATTEIYTLSLHDALPICVRDYRPGDSLRHIHWKSTARHSQLQTKLFEPGANQQLILCLNGQTLEHAYEGIIAEYFETVVVIGASLANAALEARYPVGLFTNNNARDEARRVRLPASRHAAQLTRILETLAQLTHFTQLSFDQLLRLEAAQLPFGASLIAVSA